MSMIFLQTEGNCAITSFEQTLDRFYSSSDSLVKPLDYRRQLDISEENFLDLIKNTEFRTGYDNRVSILFQSMMTKKTRNSALEMLSSIFCANILNEDICTKILTLLQDYDYEEIRPAGVLIARNCINHKYNSVKSAAFSLFGHWHNSEAYKLLRSCEEPKSAWLKMQFNMLIKELSAYAPNEKI